MIKPFDGKTPKIHPSVFVAQTALVSGDVEIGEGSSVWPGAVVRADKAPIVIGKNVSIQDTVSIHADTPLAIGDNVDIGHGAVVHCKSVGSHCLIGINATLLQDSEIGSWSIVGANALVSGRMKVPEGSFVVGVPAQVKSRVTQEQRKGLEVTGRDYAQLAKKYKEQGF